MATRRGFLKNLFQGGVVGAAAIAAPVAVASPTPGVEDNPKFVFSCKCNRALRVPAGHKIGEIVKIECEQCHHEWTLRCYGAFFAMEGYEHRRLPDWLTRPIDHERLERKVRTVIQREDA